MLNIPSILVRTTGSALMHSAHHRCRNPQCDIVAPAIAALFLPVHQYARLIDEQSSDRTFVEFPQLRNFLWSVVRLERRRVGGHARSHSPRFLPSPGVLCSLPYRDTRQFRSNDTFRLTARRLMNVTNRMTVLPATFAERRSGDRRLLATAGQGDRGDRLWPRPELIVPVLETHGLF